MGERRRGQIKLGRRENKDKRKGKGRRELGRRGKEDKGKLGGEENQWS